MQSAILVAPGRIEVQEVPVPEPGPGEVVLQVRSALTSGADLRAWRGGGRTPAPLGNEYAGVVARVGPGVTGLKEGDAVMTAHSAPCGSCFHCDRGEENLCEGTEAGAARGGMAEYVRVGAPIVRRNMFPKPPGLDFREAAFLEPLASVVQGLQSIPLLEEDTVVILGTGAIGLLHLLALKVLGRPRRIVMAGRGAGRLALASELGAHRVVDADRESAVEVVRELTGGYGAQVVLECAGRPEAWNQVVDLACRGSHILLFGGCPGGLPVEFDTTRLHYDQIALVGTYQFTPVAVRAAYELLARGEVRPAPLLSGSLPLGELPGALERLDRGEGVKYEVNPSQGEERRP